MFFRVAAMTTAESLRLKVAAALAAGRCRKLCGRASDAEKTFCPACLLKHNARTKHSQRSKRRACVAGASAVGDAATGDAVLVATNSASAPGEGAAQ